MSAAKETEKAEQPKKAKGAKTNNSYQNNGNLEDCYTNIFSLMEVNGLKWKCYRTPKNAPRGVPLTSDPVLQAYSKLVQEGVMTTWRRTQQIDACMTDEALPLPHFSHDMLKELWVFWYGDPPEFVEDICKDLDFDDEGSSANSGTSVSYEVRVLLFKALHVIMERSLMKNGFVRFGRWFTMPLRSRGKHMQYMYPAYTIAIRFNFFVHGGNTICVIVDAQRQPTLIQLHRRHLEHKSMKRFAVIVGPWSMRGILVQNQLDLLNEPKMQTNAEREWNDWKQFVQLDVNDEVKPEPEAPSTTTQSTENTSAPAKESTESEEVTVKTEIPDNDSTINTASPSTSSEANDSDEEITDDEEDDEEEDNPKSSKIKDVPKMVLVEIDGVRMLYPSKYVCVTLEDDRHVWDALGYRMNTVPDELIVQGRRPRNRFVVQMANSLVPLQGVYQHALARARTLQKPKPISIGGFAQPFPPTDEKFCKWSFNEPYELVCDKCVNGRIKCEACLNVDKRLKLKGSGLLTKTAIKSITDSIGYQFMKKPDVSAYHRVHNSKTSQLIKLKDRQRLFSEGNTAPLPSPPYPMKSNVKKRPETKEKSPEVRIRINEDGVEECEAIRERPEDEPWVIDDDNPPEWLNLTKEEFKTNISVEPDAAVDKFWENCSEGTSEDTPSSPFTPVTALSPCDGCDWPAMSAEEMPEETFNTIFRCRPDENGATVDTQKEKAEKWDCYYNPTLESLRKTPSFADYHVKRWKVKKEQSNLSMNDRNISYPQPKYGRFAQKKNGLKATSLAKRMELDRKKDEKKNESQKDVRRSLKNSIRSLIRIRDRPVKMKRKWKKLKRKRLERSEYDLDDMDIRKINEDIGEDFKTRMDKRCGYISPIYPESPSSSAYNSADESESKGLGEGTSRKYSNGEPMEIEKMTKTEEMINTQNGHIDHTDGLLSPPASNEMPRGGPLSVGAEGTYAKGPPSIEGVAMNQIYPTPPSVQMVQGEGQMLHSPILCGKGLRKDNMPPIMEEVERVDVPGGNGVISEISSDDELENLKELSSRCNTKKLNRLLSIVKNGPLSASKRKLQLPLSEKFSVNRKEERECEIKVYSKMNEFETPSMESFGKLISVQPPSLSAIPQPMPPPQTQSMMPSQQMPPHQFAPQPMPQQTHPSNMPPYYHPYPGGPQYPPHPAQNQGFQMQFPMGFNGQGVPPHHKGPPHPPPYPGAMPMMGPGGNNFPPNSMGQFQPRYGGPMGGGMPHMPYGNMPPQMQPMRQPMMPQQMMNNRPMPPQQPPPAYGAMPPYGAPGQYPMNRPMPPPSSVQQLNNFVNQPRFGQQPYGGMPHPQQQPHPMMNQNGFAPPQMDMMRPMGNAGGYQQGMMGMQHMMPGNQMMQQHLHQQQQQQQQQHQQQLQHNQHQQMMMRQHSQMGPTASPVYPSPTMNSSVPETVTPFRNKEPQILEGDSVVIAIIMSDTILDLHFDTALDSCPICSCTVSIRSRELGLYITPAEVLRTSNSMLKEQKIGTWSGFHVNTSSSCTCGFSAIRHRYLSLCSGLFPEDSSEATALENSVANVAPSIEWGNQGFEVSKNVCWFDSASPSDLAVLDQIRQLAHTHSYGKAVAQMAALAEQADRVSKAVEIGMDVTSSSEYVISHVDSMELLLLGNSAIEMSMRSMATNRNQAVSPQKFLTYFHPWGLQTANEIRDPHTNEWKSILNAISPSLVDSIRVARKITAPASSGNLIEGPLTWKKFVTKSLKNRMNAQQVQEDDSAAAEPLPAVVVATANDPVRASPMVRTIFNHAQLAPIDQPKDVMYITIIPDDDVVYSKTLKFMEQVTKHYEKMRLGRHIPFPVSSGTIKTKTNRKTVDDSDKTKVKIDTMNPIGDGDEATCTPKTWDEVRKLAPSSDENSSDYYEREGIVRVGGWMKNIPSKFPSQTAASSAEFANMTKHLNDNSGFVTRLKMYTQQMEDIVVNALLENSVAFERYGYRYQIAVEARLKKERETNMRERNAQQSTSGADENSMATGDPTNTQSSGVTEHGVQEQQHHQQHQHFSSSAPPQVPSPIPAGIVHIPETLPENERRMQPTLTELLSEPSSLMPVGAANIQWVQRDTSVPNPFPTSSQPPVDYEDVGGKEKDDIATLPHVIVIYMTNPFTWGTDHHTTLHMRVALLSFIRTFNSIVAKLPMHRRPQLQMEIIGLDQIEDFVYSIPDYLNDPKIPMELFAKSANSNFMKLEERERIDGSMMYETAKSLSIAVFTHPRVFLPDCYRLVQPRCMTALGPGSQLLRTVEELERLNLEYANKTNGFSGTNGVPADINRKGMFAYKIPSNIIQLAPPPAVYQSDSEGKVVVSASDEHTLLVSYCLVGGDFLVATVTDSLGKLIDNCVINMKPKHEGHCKIVYKQKTQILDAMGRLWSFILGVLASDVKNWRLVIGRLGRIGHGEFRAWSHLLNKTSLMKYSSRLKDICSACNQMPGIVGTPAILSACLITIEPEPHLRVFPDFFDTEQLSKKGRQLMTPDDLSCTHIITFPVGAEINYETQDQSSDQKAEENWEFSDLDIMDGLDDGDSEIMKDIGLTETPQTSTNRHGHSSFFNDEASNIEYQNQPLASGYYISTSAAPELPDWFWSSCPSAKRSIPVHLKSSLHINVTEVKNDDLSMESAAKEKDKDKDKDSHPLESHHTEEVLRYVLESYNALSWLNVDPSTGERYSCMPIHIQHLLRLYHSIVRLIL